MAAAFSRTLRSLSADRGLGTYVVFGTATFFVASWLAWMLFARMDLFVVSKSARVEIDAVANAVDAPVAGRVISNAMRLGEQVHVGDVLLELDSNRERLQLTETRARRDAIGPQVEALARERATLSSALTSSLGTGRAALERARGLQREAEAAARFSEARVARTRQLRSAGAASELQLLQDTADAAQRRAAVEAATSELTRLTFESRMQGGDRQARLDAIAQQEASLTGTLHTLEALIGSLENEIALRQIRAPVDGTIASTAVLRPGSVVAAGAPVATILPQGHLRMVAECTPADVFGRVRVQQHARARMDGFPWTQFGTVELRVLRVANEVRNGTVRVELAIADPRSTQIPLQHGQPGSVEIAVEHVAPWTLLARSVSSFIHPASEPPAPASPQSGSVHGN